MILRSITTLCRGLRINCGRSCTVEDPCLKGKLISSKYPRTGTEVFAAPAGHHPLSRVGEQTVALPAALG